MEISGTRSPRGRPRSPASRASGSRGACSSASARSCPTSGPAGAPRARPRFTYLVGGNPTTIAIIVCIAIAVALTTSPVVYKALETAEFFKVGLTIVFLAIAIIAAIDISAWGDLQRERQQPRHAAEGDVGDRDAAGRPRVRGRGRANNLVQSNWIREKGFGMGKYVPKIESPLTGEPEPQPTTGTMMQPGRGEHQALQAAGSRSPTRSSSSPSGRSAWPRSSSSRCWPTRRCVGANLSDRPTSTSSRARARSSRTSSGRGSARSSGSSARCR